MLKEDLPLFSALLAVALAIFLCWAVPAPNGDPTQNTERCTTHECREDAATEALAKYTKWLVIVTAALAAFSITQGIFLYRSDQTARIAAEAARDSAKHLPVVERGYVFVHGDNAYNIAYEPIPSFASVTLKNHGKTPVVITRVARFLGYLPPDFSPELMGKAQQYTPIYPEIVLESGGWTQNPITVQGMISTREYDAAASGKGHFVVLFRVEYTDVFGLTHETAFCECSTRRGFVIYPSSNLNYRT